jgi:hypothetical protein
LSAEEIVALYNSTKTYHNFTGLDEGTHGFTGHVVDEGGNRNDSGEREVNVDTVDPVISLISPAEGYSTTDTGITFSYNVSDASVVSNCSLILDGAVADVDDSVSRGVTEEFTSTVGVGSHTWSVNCTDSAGNVGNSSTRSLTIESAEVVVPSEGGGGGPAAVEELTLDVKNINIDMVVGETKERVVKVTNKGEKEEIVSVSQRGLDDIVDFDNVLFKLAAGQSKELKISFVAPDDPEVYTGEILIGGKKILVSLNLRSYPVLFDVMIVVPDAEKEVEAGERVGTQVTLIPVGSKPRVDVTLNYFVKDFRGNVYIKESETMLVEEQKSFKKEFFTGDLSVGSYVIAMEVIYPNGVATSSSHFVVVERVPAGFGAVFIVLIVGIMVLIVLVVMFMARYKKHKKYVMSRERGGMR